MQPRPRAAQGRLRAMCRLLKTGRSPSPSQAGKLRHREGKELVRVDTLLCQSPRGSPWLSMGTPGKKEGPRAAPVPEAAPSNEARWE